jgi:hypothetical protein
MPELSVLIGEYCSILEQERQLEHRKQRLKEAIRETMVRMDLPRVRCEQGSAIRTSRFKLTPRKEPVLDLLNSEDLFPFAHFTPPRVKELLVPRYGRETLLPLFDIEKIETLMVQRPRPTYFPDQEGH